MYYNCLSLFIYGIFQWLIFLFYYCCMICKLDKKCFFFCGDICGDIKICLNIKQRVCVCLLSKTFKKINEQHMHLWDFRYTFPQLIHEKCMQIMKMANSGLLRQLIIIIYYYYHEEKKSNNNHQCFQITSFLEVFFFFEGIFFIILWITHNINVEKVTI